MEPRTIYGIFHTKNGQITRQLQSDFIYTDKSEAETRCTHLKELDSGTVIGDAIFGYAVGPLTLV